MKWNLIAEEEMIEEVFNESTLTKGEDLYAKGRVKIQKIVAKGEKLEVSAFVNGTKRYDVGITVGPNPSHLEYSCSCPAYKTYLGACKHIVAVMYEYNEQVHLNNAQPGSSMKQEEYRAARYIMDHMADFLDADTGFRGRKKVQFEFHLALESLDNEGDSSIRIKVGMDKLYQMKDIEQNIQYFLNERPLFFGKEFTYDPAEHYVSSKDREMLYLLLELKNYHFQSQSYYSYRSGNRSEMEIPPVLVKETLKKIIQMDHYQLKFHHRDGKSLTIKEPMIFEEGETMLPIPFEISEVKGDDNHYRFSLIDTDENSFRLFPVQKIMVQNNDFFFLTDEEIRILNVVANALQENDQHLVLIPKQLMKDFLINTVPSIQKRFPLTVSESVKKHYHKEPLVTKMYLDWREDMLWMDIEFHYGGQFYNPLVFQMDKQELPESMLLDLEGEGKALNLVYKFDFPFEMTDKSLGLSDPEEIYRFLFEALPQFTEIMEIYTTTNVDHIIYTPPHDPQLVIDMNTESNLLHITFDIEGIEEKDLKKIMQDLMTNKKYRRLSNGKIINLQDRAFQEYHATLDKLEISAKQVKREMDVPLHRIFALDDDLLRRANLKNPVQEFLQRLDSLEETTFPLPKALQANLRPYQEEGYQWLKMMDHYGFGGILADDMGLGKTIQALTFIASTIEEQTKPILVICPSSVLFNWQKESKQFIPGVETALITGNKEERMAAVKEAQENNVPLWITSYPVLLRDMEIYENLEFRTVILDEAQIVKNNVAKTTRAVRQLKAFNKFALSGTPLENQLGELYSIFAIVVPGLFTSPKTFKQLEVEQINRKIRPFVLRRLKKDVLKELPEKVESVEYIDLSPEQKAMYVSQLRLVQNETNEILEQGTLNQNRIKILAGLTRLRQICCDPRLVNPEFTGESAKLERLIEYLDNARENGKRVVLFSQFTQMLDLIKRRLAEQERDYFYLDGSTPNQDRLELTTRFNEGEKDLFLISLRAGGTGLNLTGGDTVILYDSWWNPAVESQATDRVHRYGQKKMVQVIRMICTGTIEERINELQDKKRDLMDRVITDGKQSLTSLTKDEILGILND